MSHELGRRELLQASVAGGVMYFGLSRVLAAGAEGATPVLISPGCRGTKVKVARLYLVGANKMWPTPKLDVTAERKRYEAEFDRMKEDFADIDFAVDELVGFIVACALVRPEKLEGMQPSSVKKKMKQKSFAAAVKREDIENGAELLGLPLDEHITHVITGMQGVAQELGLG